MANHLPTSISNRDLCFSIIVAFTLAAMFLPGCKDDVGGSGPIDVVFPDSNVSYGKHVQPLFDRGCAFSGCHGSDTFVDRGYSLDSYQNARSRAGIIVPFDPDGSVLILAVEGKAANSRRMPVNRDPLTANQLAGLRKWITEGARNN